MILNNKSLLLLMSELKSGFWKKIECMISQLPIINNVIEAKIDNITDKITMYLKLHSVFSK
jgi:hypothetical protein